jgi:hypothetical protein
MKKLRHAGTVYLLTAGSGVEGDGAEGPGFEGDGLVAYGGHQRGKFGRAEYQR